MKKNIFLLKLDYFFGGFWLLAPLVVIYFQSITNSYMSAMAVFSLASFTTLLFEIPSGIVSDLLGRKKTLLFSGIFSLLCFFLWALAGESHSVVLLFIGSIFWGLSDAFVSGTDEAIMYETMEELNNSNNFDSFFASACAWNQFGLALSAVLGAGIVYLYSLQVLAWCAVIPALLGLITVLFLKEPSSKSSRKKYPPLHHFKKSIKLLCNNKKLYFFSFINIVDNAITTPLNRLEGAYFEKLIPLWAISFVRFIKQIFGILGFYLFSKTKKIKKIYILFYAFLGSVFFKASALILNNFVSPIFMAIAHIFYGPATVVQTDLLQQNFSSEQRATMRSILSFCEKLLTCLLFPTLGFIADTYTIYIAIAITIIIKLILAVFVFYYKKLLTSTQK